MALFQIPDVSIRGISACVPKKVFRNSTYEHVPEKDRELLIKTIGVKEKRHVDEDVTSSDLCFKAANELIDALQWARDEIDLLVFVSQTRDYMMPATACTLQDRLHLSKNCMAFDLDMGCSGYIYGLSVVYGLISAGQVRKALLLAGEVPTPNSSYEDKSVYPLFGDAGTATAIEFNSDAPPAWFNMQTDGSGFDAIMIPDGGMRNRIDPVSSFVAEEVTEGIKRNRMQIGLDGMKVFNFTLREVRPNIKKLLEFSGLDISQIDYFVFHQANRLMNETLRKQLKIDPEKFLYSIGKFGNTSSASIPLTIVYTMQGKEPMVRTRFLCSGFGVGLSWGSVLLETEKLYLHPLIEY